MLLNSTPEKLVMISQGLHYLIFEKGFTLITLLKILTYKSGGKLVKPNCLYL